MYIHLFDWKWSQLEIQEPGIYRGNFYDPLLPDEKKSELFPLYPPIKNRLLKHQKNYISSFISSWGLVWQALKLHV